MNTTNFHIGLAIKELAHEKNVSVDTLSDRLKVVRQAVYETFERETVRKSTVKKYAEALGVDQDEILKKAGFKPYETKASNDSAMMLLLEEMKTTIKDLRETVKSQQQTIQALVGKSDSVYVAGFVPYYIFLSNHIQIHIHCLTQAG